MPVNESGVEGGAPVAGGRPDRRPGEWITHSTIREVYSNWWMTLRVDDVEKPDGSHTEHEVVIGPDAAGLVVLHPERGVLMMWRHRFLPDTWGWEIPGGSVDPGEDPEAAACREFCEETGWRPVGPIRLLTTHHPSVGFVRQTFRIYLGADALHEGDPPDANEAARIEWRTPEQVAADIAAGEISDAFSQLGLVLALSAQGRGDVFATSTSQ